jgi:Ca2+-binding RTX toxin-like protein
MATIEGTDDADILAGGSDRDLLYGRGGDDQLLGGGGGDTFEGGAGADLIVGGLGTDTLVFWTATAGVALSLVTGGTGGDAAGDVYISIDHIYGTPFADVLEGNDLPNMILPGGGDDVIHGLGGNDYLLGAAGNQTFYPGEGIDRISGGAGIDTIRYDDSLVGVVVGMDGGDVLEGGIEIIIGSQFADRLAGVSDAEEIGGGGGDDELMGRGGDDSLDGGEGSDRAVFSGSRREYLISFDAARDAFIVTDLREGSPEGTDVVRNVETFVFSDGEIPAGSVLQDPPDGPVVGDDGDNAQTGTWFNDEMLGLGGNDTLTAGGGDDVLDGGTGDDTLTGDSGANVLTGLAGDDRLDGAAGDDTLLGGDGDDILIGGAGRDVLDGGEGFDFVSYETISGPAPIVDFVVINLAEPMWSDTLGDTFVSIEGVIGSDFDDFISGRAEVGETLIGGVGGDVLFGAGGGDILVGGVGDDLLFGSDGIDRFEGGDGIDIVSYSHGQVDLLAGIMIDLGDPSRNTGQAAGDSYDSIEAVLGSIADDTMVGDASDNILMGSWGSDRLIGGPGADVLNGDYFFPTILKYTVGYEGDTIPLPGSFDVASYETATSGIVASLADPTRNTGDAAGDTYVSIESLVGSAFDDVLVGWVDDFLAAGADTVLEGGAGDDTLIGGFIGDTFNGGEGNDIAVLGGRRADYTITFDAATQTFLLTEPLGPAAPYDGVSRIKAVETLQFADATVSVASLFAGSDGDDALTGTGNPDDLSGAAGNDVLVGLDADDRLDGGTGDDTLEGGAGNDNLLGGAGNDTLEGGEGDDALLAGEGNDTLSGGTGVNAVDGGAGTDTISYDNAAAAVRIDLMNRRAEGAGRTDTLLGIENAIGSGYDDILIGHLTENTLVGGAGDDVLSDALGVGADILDGGEGNDTASYTDASTVSGGVKVDLAIGGPQSPQRGDAADTLISIENLIGSAGDDTLKGDGGANRLTGAVGADTLIGRAGDDVLDGGAGLDTASYAESSTGVTIDLAIAGPQSTGEGADTLIGIENTTGSAFADALLGTGERNILTGGAGDDLLAGRGGGDRLEGGEGVDTASYVGATARVSVDLSSASGWFPDIGDSDQLSGIENVIGTAFADTITGDAGSNALRGEAGNDTLGGGLGRDMLTGGAGNDIFDLNALAESGIGAGSRDLITDFQRGVDDIDLTDIDANTARSGDQGFSFIGTAAFRGRAGELRYQTIDQAGTADDITVVSGDIDGDGVGDFEIEFLGLLHLAKNDFLL